MLRFPLHHDTGAIVAAFVQHVVVGHYMKVADLILHSDLPQL